MHNLTSNTTAITNAVPWPDKMSKEDEKAETTALKNEFKQKVRVLENQESRQLNCLYLEKFNIYKVLYKCSPVKSDAAISEADK